MWFAIFKLLRVGVKEAKKHKAKKNGANADSDPDSNIDLSTTARAHAMPDSTTARNPLKPLLETLLRFIQFAFGLAVIGLYAQDLHGRHPPAWVYAVVTGFLACATALIYLVLPFVMKGRVPLAQRAGLHLPLFVWEAVMCVLWLTLFGIFGKMYIGVYTEGDGVKRMRHAVWVDLVNLGLWVGTMVWAGMRWWKGVKGERGVKEEDVEKGVVV
ncbi:MARVEL domain-containing protein [Aspergillus clavatus NRRL 1]|uniref:MARVEL domain-containing protein n=1 Tax=Aspergillus clavatus (strain ATCC 1007 / CBS 513.65 / DSM 816 / NCTC 3887 / NRRL 1 / QM 1276 / 107) TaxID=344612 RepID=A1CAH3_ASPCL|nr:uncharacterized protein ACLA_011680 [Aspergillus clavatus NRRL 1]EAW12741.1 conserved hypothetical protein [Aspergillus clavatus NRRL 1]